MTGLLTAPATRRATFHTLTVDRVERLTDEAVAVTFAVPAELALPGGRFSIARCA